MSPKSPPIPAIAFDELVELTADERALRLLGYVAGGAAIAAGMYLFITQSNSPSTTRRISLGQCCALSVRGICNEGNTCFSAAFVQLMASSSPFVAWLQHVQQVQLLLEEQHLVDEDGDVDDDVPQPDADGVQHFIGQLYELIQCVNCSSPTTDDESMRPTSSGHLLDALRTHRWHIDHNQQDMFELCNVFLTQWEEEITGILRRLRPDDDVRTCTYDRLADDMLPSTSKSTAMTTFELMKRGERERIEQGLKSPIDGHLHLQTTCSTCGHQVGFRTTRRDRFTCLSLDLPRSGINPVTLYSLLRAHLSTEIIKDARCDGCSVDEHFDRKVTLVRKPSVDTLPRTLVLRIDRLHFIDGRIYKSDVQVALPEQLHLNALMAHLGDRTKRQVYSLRSVAVHIGSTSEFGHFVTYRRSSGRNDKWVKCNDAIVTECSWNTVQAQNAYMVVYDRVD